jgi:hypothetical protein
MKLDDALPLFRELSRDFPEATIHRGAVEEDAPEYVVEFPTEPTSIRELAAIVEAIRQPGPDNKPRYDGEVSIRLEGDHTQLWFVVTTRLADT